MMNSSMFTGVTMNNFQERVEMFMRSCYPRFKSFETAAREYVWRLNNVELADLADSSDDYEFDELYLMDEISSRTGVTFTERIDDADVFNEVLYLQTVDNLRRDGHE